ncbi:MAG TPA: hypothetical protein VFP89_02605 [Propionibacteriaceae bacterium]|nr:hypothetical protein [Propionibacteriaceae bacterium]
MGELRLYAIGIDEVRGMFGTSGAHAERLRGIAQAALAPDASTPSAAGARKPGGGRPGGLLTKLGPIFKRPPAALVISPTQPTPEDLEVLLAGSYVPPARTGATWRMLEILVQGCAWGSTSVRLDRQSMDELDFALARGGVSSASGLRHLLSCTTGVNLLPVQGLTVGWYPHQKALAMAAAYRAALPEVNTSGQQEIVGALVGWMDSFGDWTATAVAQGRPVPDLVGFWAS